MFFGEVRIMELSRTRKKEITSLSVKKYRDRRGELLVEGVRSVASAVEAGAHIVDIVATPAGWQDARVKGLLEAVDAPVFIVPDRAFSALSDVETSQGILAVAKNILFPEEELFRLQTILMLDGVQDPGNLGTIVRSAAWFGVDAIVTGPGSVDFSNPKVVRSSMGGFWSIRRVESIDLVKTLRVLTGKGFSCYGADLQGIKVREWNPSKPSVLVLGNESHGISRAVKDELPASVTIPSTERFRSAESLNVAVAAGIFLYEWTGKNG